MSNEHRELMLSFNIIGYICGGFVLVGGLAATEIFIQLGQLSESDRKFMRIAQLMFLIALVSLVYWIFTHHT